MNACLEKLFIASITAVLCSIFLINCNGTRIIFEKGASHQSNPSIPHAVKGPPPWAPAHGYRAKHKYRYYPSSRVYFDTGREIYFYYKNGDWHVGVSLPMGIRIDVNEFVTLEMESDKPYRYHSEVEKRYPPGKVKIKKKKGKAKSKKPPNQYFNG
jgi:hypothetical protein